MINALFTKHTMGSITLPNRIAMSPMTRSRFTQPGDIPNAMMASYYAQRASAGMIITEATQISKHGKGYSFTPGIHSDAQVNGWKLVTDAVHTAGGRIYLQLWHMGRMSHESFHADGKPVAPSALSPDAQVWVVDETTGIGSMVDCPVPRALTINEIKTVVEDFRQGAADVVAYGRSFIANPDLPRRFAEALPLTDFDAATLFGGTEFGYNDYRAWHVAV